MFQWGIRQWTELETQMTCVERIVEYTKLDSEENPQNSTPPPSWPSEGIIKFSSVSLRYSPDEPYVLKNLNFTIRSNEKVGIVGRTGAGKSSLIYAMFQLTKTEGEIIIDNFNITQISLHNLRSKISIIPQEPVLFSGTIRKNLDPFDEYSDEELWNSLEEVELKKVVAELPLGLNYAVSESGSNFSVGQRQLLCLARAIIRNNKILLLDEATANVDPHTDSLIQKAIRTKFSNCTVLTIAHRLHTVMDSNKILVMNFGKMVEFDHPYLLLKNKSTMFYSMVQQTGPSMADALFKISETVSSLITKNRKIFNFNLFSELRKAVL